jgi:PKD repeat protein
VNDSPTTLGRATMFVATAEGSNINYTWNFGDGEIAAGQVTTHIYVLSGTYTTVVTASNGSGSVTATTPVTITNLAPFANAGPDQAVGINALMTLDGSASTDPDGHLPLSYEWQQISGGPVVLSSRVISRPTFMAPNVPAVLAFSLVVTDSKALRSPVIDTVVITVSDQPITALLAVNNSPTTLGQTTWFTATAAGSNISYTWNFGDGLVTLGNPISHTYAASGFYTALVTATNGVNSLTTTLPVTITNLVPVAIAGPDQNATVNAQVDLDGSHSYDQDGHLPLAYYWTQVGGPAVILSNAVISQLAFTAPATPGVLTFTLCVTDAYGLASAVDTTVVHVNDQVITGLQASNSSPIKVGQAVTFTATLRTGSNVLYQWNFGDDTISEPTNLLTMTHVYSRYSSFTAIVTATNQSGIEIGDTLVVVQPYSIYIPLLRKDS